MWTASTASAARATPSGRRSARLAPCSRPETEAERVSRRRHRPRLRRGRVPAPARVPRSAGRRAGQGVAVTPGRLAALRRALARRPSPRRRRGPRRRRAPARAPRLRPLREHLQERPDDARRPLSPRPRPKDRTVRRSRARPAERRGLGRRSAVDWTSVIAALVRHADEPYRVGIALLAFTGYGSQRGAGRSLARRRPRRARTPGPRAAEPRDAPDARAGQPRKAADPEYDPHSPRARSRAHPPPGGRAPRGTRRRGRLRLRDAPHRVRPPHQCSSAKLLP